MSGTSDGFCVTKYTPTPFERINRTTCSTFCSSDGGASLNSRCASSKKNASLGLSRSPTSGRCSNSSESIHSRNVAYSLGAFSSLSAARMLITPWPRTVCIRSLMSSIGSPKNLSAPCSSSAIRLRWMAPTLADEMLPYLFVYSDECSPTCCSIARKSFMSSSARPESSAIRKTRLSTPVWMSFSSSMRESISGPMSDTVARTGWPFSPYTSHSVTGQPAHCGSSRPRSCRRALSLSFDWPGCEMPVRSPFTSARKTGTPIFDRPCAIVCRVTVLPVPVAPIARPDGRVGGRVQHAKICDRL